MSRTRAPKYPPTPEQIFRIRHSLNQSQQVFWRSLGVSQAAGSQYERGAKSIPEPILQLIYLRFMTTNRHLATARDALDQARSLAGDIIRTIDKTTSHG